MINVEVKKTGTENNLSLIRRFTKSVQGAGVLTSVRERRYKTRTASKYTRKKRALQRIERHDIWADLLKLGKVVEKQKRR